MFVVVLDLNVVAQEDIHEIFKYIQYIIDVSAFFTLEIIICEMALSDIWFESITLHCILCSCCPFCDNATHMLVTSLPAALAAGSWLFFLHSGGLICSIALRRCFSYDLYENCFPLELQRDVQCLWSLPWKWNGTFWLYLCDCNSSSVVSQMMGKFKSRPVCQQHPNVSNHLKLVTGPDPESAQKDCPRLLSLIVLWGGL